MLVMSRFMLRAHPKMTSTFGPPITPSLTNDQPIHPQVILTFHADLQSERHLQTSLRISSSLRLLFDFTSTSNDKNFSSKIFHEFCCSRVCFYRCLEKEKHEIYDFYVPSL